MLRKTILCLTLLSVFVLAARGAEQPSVYIEESQSWTVNDWIPFTGLLGALGGGSRPQTIEIIHTFTKRCPQLAPTREREGVDFVVVLEREGGKSIFRKDNKYAVFTGAGDLVEVGSTHMASTAVSQASGTIMAKETGKAINRGRGSRNRRARHAAANEVVGDAPVCGAAFQAAAAAFPRA